MVLDSDSQLMLELESAVKSPSPLQLLSIPVSLTTLVIACPVSPAT